MEARKKRNIKSGAEYDPLFPGSQNDNKTIQRNANVYDTVSFIPKVVQKTTTQTNGIAKKLKGKNLYDTCRNIWQFVYDHIDYKKDDEGFEQIRSPARTWHDRKRGVDCDCYSVFISSILTNLGIPHTLRITKYHRDYFQHIYPIVPNGSRYITIDCVTDQFDYEVPYREKKDYSMDLQYLDGLDGEALGLFGKKKKKKAAATAAKAAPTVSTVMPAATSIPVVPPPKKKGFFKKVLNVVNKVNPVTLLLRNGVLAAMKLNIKNVARRLRWSYLSPDKIATHGIDPARFQKLVATRQKLENIFYGAGGKPDNLRKAILEGKGNKDKAVSGFGTLPMQPWSERMNEYTPLGELLGNEIYYSENVEGMNGFQGFGELGEPVTLASVGAAMGVIAGIVAALKQVGDIFKKKQAGSADFDAGETEAPENNVSIPAAARIQVPTTATNPIVIQNTSPASAIKPANQPGTAVVRSPSNYTLPAETETDFSEEEIEENKNVANTSPSSAISKNDTPDNNTKDNKEGFWDKNKKWIKPVAFGVGGLTLIAIGYTVFKGKKVQHTSSSKQTLSGLPRKKKKKKNPYRKKHHPKRAVALL